MNADIVLLILLLLFTAYFISRKTHVAYVTLALFGGYVLSDKAAHLISRNAGDLINDTEFPFYTIARLILLFGPPIMVFIHFRNTQSGSSRFIEQLIPSFSLSLLIAVFVVEQLNYSTRTDVLDNSVALNQLWLFTPYVVVFALGAALFDIMSHRVKPDTKKSKKKK